MSVTNEADELFLKCLESLQKVRSENLEPALFWPKYAEILTEISSAQAGVIAIRGQKEDSPWQVIAFSPPALRSRPLAQTIASKLPQAWEASKRDGSAAFNEDGHAWAALHLKTGVETQWCLALFYFGEAGFLQAEEGLKTLKLLDDLPANYQVSRSAQDAILRREQFAKVLDLMTLMNTQGKFISAAMTFCNELAARHQCDRVSLGWHKDGYVKLKAMSHVDDFDKKMETVQKAELAMEEAFDQDAEITVPAPKDTKLITRDHEAFARHQETRYVCSLPLRLQGKPVGVCAFERNTSAFSDADLRLLRLSCDQAARRLDDLRNRDLWFSREALSMVKKKLEGLLGCTHTWGKALAIAGSLLLAFICFVPVTYRLESPVILKTDDVSFLTAPFDGHIERVQARVGDALAEGDELLAMDRSDLILEEAGLMAENNRYQRESEKARAAGALADMRIAEALRDQAAARLDLARYRLSQSVIRAPFAGVVVEGDQKERVGAPLKQGDVLFKVGRMDKLYAQLEVRESEIHHVNSSLNGEIALATRPQDTFKINVARVEPSAVSKDNGNVFLVRCEFPNGIPEWWKPGMTGVSKLNAGKKTLLWIFTHRTIDFLRLKLWW